MTQNTGATESQSHARGIPEDHDGGGAVSYNGFNLHGGWSVNEMDGTGGSPINIPYSVDANAADGRAIHQSRGRK